MPNFFQLFSKSDWKLESVDLGGVKVEIPYFEIVGNRPGKTLLVTGGMDGDEYAGMQAVYTLRQLFADGNFAGRLRLIPIVNIPGFQAECSQNPIDQIFPKLIYPGNSKGSATHKLVSWLAQTKVVGADIWFDLHGGSLTEGLQPFLWTYTTGEAELDKIVDQFQAIAEADLILHESAVFGSKAKILARQNILYLIAESGERGGVDDTDVMRHVSWVKQLMEVAGMIENTSPRLTKAKIFNNVKFVYAPFDGIWNGEELMPSELKKGEVFGSGSKRNGTSLNQFSAPETGAPLWYKKTMSMRKGDILLALAY